MTLLTDLKKILEANGITDYTDTQLEAFIDKARVLANIPGLTPHTEHDVVKDFTGDVYVTSFYPILDDAISLTINGEAVIPKLVEYDKGIIFLNNTINGLLQCTYTTGIPEEEFNVDLLPIVVQLVTDSSGKNISSITEGDVTVSYKTSSSGSDETSIDALIRNFRAKYDTMVRWV